MSFQFGTADDDYFACSINSNHLSSLYCNITDQIIMAEVLLSEFNGFEGDCVLKEVDNVDVMNDIEKEKKIGEKVCEDEGKRNRHEFKSQAGSKKKFE